MGAGPGCGSSGSGGGAGAGLHLSDIPLDVFYRLCAHIKANFLDTEGLFRMSGAVEDVRAMRAALARDPKMPFGTGGAGERYSAHTYTSVLTSYLREQTESLFPFAMYDSLCAAQAVYSGAPAPGAPAVDAAAGPLPPLPEPPSAQTPQERGVAMLAQCVARLPQRNRLLLHCLVDLLAAVSAHAAANRMTASNLGVVFGPTLVKKENEDLLSMLKMTERCDIVATVVTHALELFPVPPNPQHYTGSSSGGSGGGSGVSVLCKATQRQLQGSSGAGGAGASFSANSAHERWFASFPGFLSAQALLAQAEAAVASQLSANAETQRRLQRQTVDSQALAVALRLQEAGGVVAAAGVQRELAEARAEAHRASLALSQVIIKLVDVIRDKAALEEENARMYAQLETARLQHGYVVPGGGGGAPGAATTTTAADNSITAAAAAAAEGDGGAVAQQLARVAHLDSDVFAFEPRDVLARLAGLETRLAAACDGAVPPSAQATLVAAAHTVRRSAALAQTLRPATGSGAESVQRLLDDASAQLQRAAGELDAGRACMRAAVHSEVARTAEAIVAHALGEDQADAAGAGAAQEPAAAAGPSEMAKALAVLGIDTPRVVRDSAADASDPASP